MDKEKLNTLKEKLPLGFITSFINKGWEEIDNLKNQIEIIKETFSETQRVEELLQNLVDAYLICIGQLEEILENKNLSKENINAEVKESLKEDTNINIEKLIIQEPAVEAKIEKEPEIKPEEPEVIIQPINNNPLPFNDIVQNTNMNPIELEPCGEAWEYFCDFDDIDK